MKAQSLVRTKQHTGNVQDQEELYAQTPILDLVTPLSSICTGWTQTEVAAGRRLVRFAKVQDGRRLIVSCEPIMQEDFCESDSVISCIYREESDSCFVTSVDVIYLLERLTNGEFPVEEKNRIRRNLEGLRPTTVSKHKPGFGDFFQRIMEFPDPKPRNIEKDLKVFEWNLLGQALEKILSKYVCFSHFGCAYIRAHSLCKVHIHFTFCRTYRVACRCKPGRKSGALRPPTFLPCTRGAIHEPLFGPTETGCPKI